MSHSECAGPSETFAFYKHAQVWSLSLLESVQLVKSIFLPSIVRKLVPCSLYCQEKIIYLIFSMDYLSTSRPTVLICAYLNNMF